MNEQQVVRRREAPLITPTDLSSDATRDIGGAMNAILADVFALYLKTKNFHWHLSGPHFRDDGCDVGRRGWRQDQLPLRARVLAVQMLVEERLPSSQR